MYTVNKREIRQFFSLFFYLTSKGYQHRLSKIKVVAKIGEVALKFSCYITVIDCGLPEHVSGAENYIYANTLYGSSFNFVCKTYSVRSGVSVNGDYIVTCQENRRWGFGNLTCTGK